MPVHVEITDTITDPTGVLSGTVLYPTVNALTAPLANGRYGRLIYANTTIPAGSTLIGSTTETAFPLSVTVPANTVVTGTSLTVRIRGYYSTTVATVGSLTLNMKLNGTAVETGTMTALNFAATNSSFFSSSDIHCFSASQSLAEGILIAGDTSNGAHIVSFANTGYSAIDWTADQSVTFSAVWSSVLNSTSVTLNQLAVYVDPHPTS